MFVRGCVAAVLLVGSLSANGWTTSLGVFAPGACGRKP